MEPTRLLDGTEIHTYIGYCCREWVLAYGITGKCGICGQVPKYLRDDDEAAE
jgi:hypothetical protein